MKQALRTCTPRRVAQGWYAGSQEKGCSLEAREAGGRTSLYATRVRRDRFWALFRHPDHDQE